MKETLKSYPSLDNLEGKTVDELLALRQELREVRDQRRVAINDEITTAQAELRRESINKTDYMMPGELTVKVQQLITKGGVTVGEITDTIDRYFRAAYFKGRESVAKEMKDAIGDFDDYGKEYSRVGDYISALDRVIDAIRKIDLEYRKD